MTINNLLNDLASSGIHLRIESGKLKADAPKGMMTPELRQALVNHKDELMRLLTDEKPADEKSINCIKSSTQLESDSALTNFWDAVRKQILDAIMLSLSNTGNFRIHIAYPKARWRWILEMTGLDFDEKLDKENAAEKLNAFQVAERIQDEVRLALESEPTIEKMLKGNVNWKWNLELQTYPNSIGTIEAQAAGTMQGYHTQPKGDFETSESSKIPATGILDNELNLSGKILAMVHKDGGTLKKRLLQDRLWRHKATEVNQTLQTLVTAGRIKIEKGWVNTT